MRNAAASQLFERLHALTGHFGMRLDLPEAFARRIERHGHVVHERLQIGEPPFGVADLVGDDHHQALRQGARERGHQHRIGRTGEAANTKRPTRTGEGLDYAIESREAGDRVEQTWKSHLQPVT
ncbi:hypothetical protein [Gemmatimonas sp.]|uniref:hypothetical protein n=1 Tax=Gemmatimonas sp. TaxID=1962908 RepID=UPI003DA22A70